MASSSCPISSAEDTNKIMDRKQKLKMMSHVLLNLFTITIMSGLSYKEGIALFRAGTKVIELIDESPDTEDELGADILQSYLNEELDKINQ